MSEQPKQPENKPTEKDEELKYRYNRISRTVEAIEDIDDTGGAELP